MRTKVGTKLIISAVSLLFFLGILETGLRIAGRIYSGRITAESGSYVKDGDYITILTIGDSYTVGGAVAREDSYPSILQEKLSAEVKEYVRVINGGICEANSTQVLQVLQALQHLG